jgi:hypothetical protein
VTALAEAAIPFEVYLVSPDTRQWFSVAGHLGGAGHRGGDIHVPAKQAEGGRKPDEDRKN